MRADLFDRADDAALVQLKEMVTDRVAELKSPTARLINDVVPF